MSVDEAINLLKGVVAPTNVKNQPAIDVNLLPASSRPELNQALVTIQLAIKNGECKREDILQRLGL